MTDPTPFFVCLVPAALFLAVLFLPTAIIKASRQERPARKQESPRPVKAPKTVVGSPAVLTSNKIHLPDTFQHEPVLPAPKSSEIIKISPEQVIDSEPVKALPARTGKKKQGRKDRFDFMEF